MSGGRLFEDIGPPITRYHLPGPSIRGALCQLEPDQCLLDVRSIVGAHASSSSTALLPGFTRLPLVFTAGR